MGKRVDIIANDRQTALKNNIMFYYGSECGECGGTKRYSTSKCCFSCQTKSNTRKNELRRIKRQREIEGSFMVIGNGWQY